MIPRHLHTIFWDIDADAVDPAEWPEYAIFRVLEFGDDAAVTWMREHFSEAQIRSVLASERRLSAKSANFWALVYQMPFGEVAALAESR